MPHIGDRLDYYQQKTSSIRYCLKEIDTVLAGIDNPRLEQKVAEAVEANDHAADCEYRWAHRKKQTGQVRQEANKTDDKIDRTLSGIRRVVETNAELGGASKLATKASELRDELFANGVKPITSSRFEKQQMLVDRLLERLEGPYAEHVELLSLQGLVDRLAELNETFEEQLTIVDDDEITYDEVQAARVAGREAFHKVIHVIFGDYVDEPETRQRLLAPVERQDERIGRHLSRRGQIPEVDPDSGEPTEPE